MSDPEPSPGFDDEEVDGSPAAPSSLPGSEDGVDPGAGAVSWTDLRAKPVLEWDREDWRRWVEGPLGERSDASDRPAGDPDGHHPGAPADGAEVGAGPPEVEELPGAGREWMMPDEPLPDSDITLLVPPLEVVTPSEERPAPVPEQRPELEGAASPGPPPEAPVGAPPPSDEDRAPPEPTRAVEARPRHEEEEEEEDEEDEDEPGPERPGSPVTRAGRRQRGSRAIADAGTQVRSALELVVLSVVVGTVLAGLVTVALVMAGLALRRAVG